jgi:hypothetical protein
MRPKQGLSKAEKNERDARMVYWLNQRRIERIHEGALRQAAKREAERNA